MLDLLVEHTMQNKPELIGMDDVVEKEILHQEILYVLHKEGFLSQLTFMGGTALRLCYNSNRLSEDLDFTGGENFSPGMFNGLGATLQKHLHNVYALNTTVREPVLAAGDTSTWKVTIEKHPGRPDLPSQKMHIDVCAYPSFDKVYKPVVDHYQIGSRIAGLPIPVESLSEILADKLLAFAYRERRIKPRDVWDLGWLAQQDTALSVDLIKRKLALRKKNQDGFLEKIHRHAELIRSDRTTKEDFYQEMSRFVPPEVASRTLEQSAFWIYIGHIVSNYVTKTARELAEPGESANVDMKM